MGKTSVRKRIKQFWQALTIKKKIATFTGTVFLIIAVSVLFNVWVVKFSLIDFNRILQDNAAVSELAQALEEESIQFETYIKAAVFLFRDRGTALCEDLVDQELL